MKHHVHGVVQLHLCFDVETEDPRDAVHHVARILQRVHNEAEENWERSKKLVIVAPEESDANAIALAVELGEHEEEEPPPDLQDDKPPGILH